MPTKSDQRQYCRLMDMAMVYAETVTDEQIAEAKRLGMWEVAK